MLCKGFIIGQPKVVRTNIWESDQWRPKGENFPTHPALENSTFFKAAFKHNQDSCFTKRKHKEDAY